ncbi:Hypothetical protein FKW44_020543 [Caligus rogercresseyi]|uniref:Uncharacterized protein n=1 Tax=Caligus rogercresseyi TaxID=217165 RepID=A0A7T8GXG8_CALRO|nr:Hypothetical protein FKW44_020543 [Caligus rogercresseyi]
MLVPQSTILRPIEPLHPLEYAFDPRKQVLPPQAPGQAPLSEPITTAHRQFIERLI